MCHCRLVLSTGVLRLIYYHFRQFICFFRCFFTILSSYVLYDPLTSPPNRYNQSVPHISPPSLSQTLSKDLVHRVRLKIHASLMTYIINPYLVVPTHPFIIPVWISIFTLSPLTSGEYDSFPNFEMGFMICLDTFLNSSLYCNSLNIEPY